MLYSHKHSSTEQNCFSLIVVRLRFLLSLSHILLIILQLLSVDSLAQRDATLYNLSTVSQRSYTNPALHSDYQVSIGLPLISSVYLDLHHNGFTFSDIVRNGANDSVLLDVDNAISKMKDVNYVAFTFQIDWLSVSWKAEKNQFFFNITEKSAIRMRYPKALMQLAWEGNAAVLDQTLDFEKLALRATQYREYAIGMSRELNDQLTIGAKIKYLFGIQNASLKVESLSFYTKPNTYDLTGESDLVLNTSTLPEEDQLDYILFKNKNKGLGIDVGATFALTDKITLSASAVDFGFIKWNSNVKNYSNDLDGVTFSGNALDNFTDSTGTKAFETFADSLAITFDNFVETKNSYSDGLISRVYVGGLYTLNTSSTVGALLQGEYFRKSVYPTFTLSYNYKFKSWLGASVSYSMMNRSYFNLGIGISASLGPLQLYVVSDNIAYLFNMAKVNGTILIPQKASTTHLHMGLNLVFGKKEKDRDKDGIVDKEDECPNIPGPIEYNGCPDRDGDKIVDVNDECPDDPGLPIYKGCPDRDDDKVIDKKDECPDIPGQIDNKGCPVKLFLLDMNKDTVKSAELNEDGFFVYPNLPNQERYVFKLNIDDLSALEEVQVLSTINGKETVITAIKSEEGYYIYEKITIKKRRLYLLNHRGDTLMEAIVNSEGFFVFQPLPANQSYVFLLEGDNDKLTDEMLILLIDEDGKELVIKASQNKQNLFKYEYMPLEASEELDLEEEVPVELMEEEKEIVNTAFDNLEFNTGSDVISFDSHSSLSDLSKLLIDHPDWSLKLSGHTDNVGSENSNLLLSKKRSESVKKVLMKNGVSNDRIIVRYYGESKPIAPNATPAGAQQNRRVEMLIIQKEGYIEPAEKGAIPTFENEKGVWFRAQILASKEMLPITSPSFKSVRNIQAYYDKGMYKYTFGKSKDLEQFKRIMLAPLRYKGFSEVFIVAFQDGKRIPVKKAIKLLQE